MKKTNIIWSSILILFILFFYLPNFISYISLKIAPYTKSIYAIQLDNQSFVYGSISSATRDWLKIKNVYYFQNIKVNDTETKNLVAQSSNMLTSPENFMLINRSKILSIEKVGAKSKLLDIIK
jgi:hypothetical protein